MLIPRRENTSESDVLFVPENVELSGISIRPVEIAAEDLIASKLT